MADAVVSGGNPFDYNPPWLVAAMSKLTGGGRAVDAQTAIKAVKGDYTRLLHSCLWTHFITATFRGRPHPEECNKRFVAAFRAAGQRSASWVRVLEYQTRGAVHYHAMAVIWPFPSYTPGALEKQLRRRCGVSSVDMIWSADAVAGYCAKYITKAISSEFCHIDFSKTLRRLGSAASRVGYYEILAARGTGDLRLF